MGDFGSEVLRKYGTAAVVFAVVAGLLIWFLAHWTAAPGKEISVLWGLVKYTKQSSVPISTESTNDFIDHQESQQQVSRAKLPQINLVVRHGVSKQNRAEVMGALRAERNLRELTAVESGKRVRDLSAGTYFFLYFSRFDNTILGEALLSRVSREPADRYPLRSTFEVHYPREGELLLIGYVNEIQAAEISKLSGEVSREIMVFPSPWSQMTTLVSIPIKRIQTSRARHMQASPEDEIGLIDVKVR